MFTFAYILPPTCFWVRVRSSSDPVGVSMSRWIISRLVLINLKPKLLSFLWSGYYPLRLFLASHFADNRCRKACLLSNIIDLKNINLCHEEVHKSQPLLLITLHIAALCGNCIISIDLQHIFEHVRVEFIYTERLQYHPKPLGAVSDAVTNSKTNYGASTSARADSISNWTSVIAPELPGQRKIKTNEHKSHSEGSRQQTSEPAGQIKAVAALFHGDLWPSRRRRSPQRHRQGSAAKKRTSQVPKQQHTIDPEAASYSEKEVTFYNWAAAFSIVVFCCGWGSRRY